MITLYGIRNCDTVKKARMWLSANNIDYRFHDFQTDGLDKTTLQRWCALWGWENVLNKRGTTWRRLPENDILNLNESKAHTLMLNNLSVIKRPVLDDQGFMLQGFDEKLYAEHFLKHQQAK